MRVRRRAKGRREPLSDAVKYHLLTGDYAERGRFSSWFDAFALTPDQQRAAWLEHRAELLAAWIGDRPGTRPWAWWFIDAPEARQVLRGARESEPSYLARLGLLTAAERGRLAPGAFDPVPIDPDDELARLDALGYHDPEDEGDCS